MSLFPWAWVLLALCWLALSIVSRDIIRAWQAWPLRPSLGMASMIGGDKPAWLACRFRGLYGDYPREFRGYRAELTADGLLMRPGLLLRRRLPAVTVTEELLSARPRPLHDAREAQRLGSRALFSPGGPLEEPGFVVISCRTSRGVLEFSVLVRDAHVLLFWIDVVRHRQAAGHSGPEKD